MSPDKTMLSLIALLGQYQTGRRSDLFQFNNLKKKAKSYFDRLMKDVPNVYTQHRPYIFEEVIPDFASGKIVNEENYRIAFNGRGIVTGKQRPVIIVFFVGGATYTEAKEADEFQDAKVIIGGSFVHNSKTFIGEVIQLKESMEF